jgi:hypothetical protein
MLAAPLMAAAVMPTMGPNMSAPAKRVGSFSTAAAAVMGVASRKLKAAARSRENPRRRAMLMVAPDLETPGTREPRPQDQVAGAADGQELSRTLQEAENGSPPRVHRHL